MNPPLVSTAQKKKELGTVLTRIGEVYGSTILLVEHDMRLLMSVSKTVSVINFGRLVATGPTAEVQSEPSGDQGLSRRR